MFQPNRSASTLSVPDPFDCHVYIGCAQADRTETNKLAAELTKCHGLKCRLRCDPTARTVADIANSIRTGVASSERCIIYLSKNYDSCRCELEAVLQKTTYGFGYVLVVKHPATDSLMVGNDLLARLCNNERVAKISSECLNSSMEDVIGFCAGKLTLERLPSFPEKISGTPDAVVYACDYLFYLLENCRETFRKAVCEMWTKYRKDCERDEDENEDGQLPNRGTTVVKKTTENVHVILPIVIVIPFTCNAPSTLEVCLSVLIFQIIISRGK